MKSIEELHAEERRAWQAWLVAFRELKNAETEKIKASAQAELEKDANGNA